MISKRLGFAMLLPVALLGGCPTQNATQDSEANVPAADTSATDSLANSAPLSGDSLIGGVARVIAQTTEATAVSVANQPAISIQPNGQPATTGGHWSQYNFTTFVPVPSHTNGAGDSGSGPLVAPGSFHGKMNAAAHEELLDTDPNMPHGTDAYVQQPVSIVIGMNGDTPSTYTIPGYVDDDDALVPITAVGESTTVRGDMWVYDVATPGWFELIVTLDTFDFSADTARLASHFTVTGGCQSMTLSGTGTHEFSVSRSGDSMDYTSKTIYLVQMVGMASGLPTVRIETRVTIDADGLISRL